MHEEKNEKVTFIEGWMCLFCGQVYRDKDEALLCWQRHTQFELEPIWGMGEEFPTEVLIKKLEGDRYTEVATYELVKKEKVDLPKRGNRSEPRQD